jgi:hypothetical protein
MKILLLAAGYGTRLEADIKAAGPTSPYAHLLGVPKPLGCTHTYVTVPPYRIHHTHQSILTFCWLIDWLVCAIVPVGGRALISRWMDMTRECPGLDVTRDLIIVTNAAHAPLYERWATDNGIPTTAIINDGM